MQQNNQDMRCVSYQQTKKNNMDNILLQTNKKSTTRTVKAKSEKISIYRGFNGRIMTDWLS